MNLTEIAFDDIAFLYKLSTRGLFVSFFYDLLCIFTVRELNSIIYIWMYACFGPGKQKNRYGFGFKTLKLDISKHRFLPTFVRFFLSPPTVFIRFSSYWHCWKEEIQENKTLWRNFNIAAFWFYTNISKCAIFFFRDNFSRTLPKKKKN